jgi:hypothetical protein
VARTGSEHAMGILQRLKAVVGGSANAPAVDLTALPSERLRDSHAAGRALQAAATSLAAEGRTVLDVVMNGNAFAKWQMYPWQGGILDQRTANQYFYHSHPDYRGEHGHFHTFHYHQRKLVHLVALGIDARGRINRLYTFNRWSPGDHYFPAEMLKTFLPRFRIGPDNALDARLHTFVTQALVLFRAEIEQLFDARDATFAHYRQSHGGASPFEDRGLEITSAVPADVDAQLRRIAAELQRRGEPAQAVPAAVAQPLNSAAPASAAPAPVEGSGPPEEGLHVPLEERPPERLRGSLEAGRTARAIAEALRAEGRTVVDVAMNGKPYEPWAMYPWQGGVIDTATRSQYFYHSHPQSPEHGHFHLFYHHRNQLVHLVALAMDNRGEPVSLFTVNRWVTDDFYLPAAELQAMLPHFRIANDAFDREVGGYLRAVLLLYEVEIAALQRERDRVFAAYRAEHNGRSPYEDRDLEVTSALKIRLEGHIAALEAELRRRAEDARE